MANHVSAAKRHIQSEKRRSRNRAAKSALHTQIKKTQGDMGPEAIRLGQQALAVAARKGVIHKKAASRRISRLMKAAQNRA
ncbi:MAG: 30S ribosomal protein S20 [Myxococcaceae bacterium]|nr:30S ribosomal protein S20 [Myxococcaceae bacterium]MBH2006235.1 30S ribosomal protein S20 [Myxococcaceae bacterium]